MSQRGWLKLGFRFLGLILAKSTTGKGIVIAEGVADVARRASRLICLVDASAQVERVVSDVAFVAGGGDIFICMSAVDLVTIQKSCDELSKVGWVLVDAPSAAAVPVGNLIRLVREAESRNASVS